MIRVGTNKFDVQNRLIPASVPNLTEIPAIGLYV
jgi:hypothetical protein